MTHRNKVYQYVKIIGSHVPPANGNSGFLIKTVNRGGGKLSQVLWFEPRSKTYSANWFKSYHIRDK